MSTKRSNSAKLHPVERYIASVQDGSIVACKWVKLAVKRHLTDLAVSHERGLHFDTDAAQHVIDFFGFLKHSKGEWAGQVVELEPWQQFYLWVLFGWKREDGTRRFRTAYQEVARKNGKTTIAAGVGLYLFDADDEPGAEVYTAATKRDQARIAHSEATRMVKASPSLRRRIRTFKDNLNILDSASKFEPLGQDADSLDGLNVHGAILDEVHAHKNRDMFDILDTATGSRRQPLLFCITTAGFDRNSLCWELHEYTEKLLNGVLEDDSFFGVIYTLDAEEKDEEGNVTKAADSWEDESTWIKANPNLGVSKKLDDMQRKAIRAREMPTALNSFLRKELNVWTQSETKWLPVEAWKNCARMVDSEGLRGRICFGGLDLSSTTDISALVLVFPPESDDEPYQSICRFWIPQEAMRERSRRDRVPYDVWVRQGFMTATPGDVIDYDFIVAEVDELAQKYDISEIAFDRWGATLLYQRMEEARQTMIQFGQGFASHVAADEAVFNIDSVKTDCPRWQPGIALDG
jgi:phage terminase large subunit-like protein